VSTALLQKRKRRSRRRQRIRGRVAGTAERPRLSLNRSNRGVFAQLIDDDRGHTLVAIAWTQDDLRKLSGIEQANKAGELLAAKAKQAGITTCIFDRGGYKYHGRVKALAEGARSGGLEF
jgi:large subunit ribosomal protein L18